VTSVPTSGPGATYFQNGAEVMAYYPAPPGTAVADETRKVSAVPPVQSESYAGDAGAQGVVASTQEAALPGAAAAEPPPTSGVRAGASTTTGLTCSPLEIEAAMAIARQFATAAAPPPSDTWCTPSNASAAVPPPAETVPASAAEPAPNSPPRPSLFSRIAPALGGALFGGLAVALWVRPRPLRVAQRRR
jgi:hypothetical protein